MSSRYTSRTSPAGSAPASPASPEAYVIEGDGIEGAAGVGYFHPHFHMALADDASVAHGEEAIEGRFRKQLPPRPAGAQRAGGLQRQLRHGQLAVGFDAGREAGGRGPARDFGVEVGGELIQVRGIQRHAGRHGVTPEARDQIGLAGCDRIQHVTDVQP